MEGTRASTCQLARTGLYATDGVLPNLVHLICVLEGCIISASKTLIGFSAIVGMGYSPM